VEKFGVWNGVSSACLIGKEKNKGGDMV
jgi:hypothetical protein